LLGLSVALLLWIDRRFFPGQVVLLAACALSFGGALELGRMGKLANRGLTPGLLLAVAGATLVFTSSRGVAASAPGRVYELAVWGLEAGILVALFTYAAKWRGKARVSLPLALFLGAWIAVPLFLLIPITAEHGLGGLVGLLVLSKIGDNAGYFVGRSIGKTHPFPNLSPGKTTAGCVASLVAGIAAGAALAATGVLPELHGGVLGGGLLGAGMNLAAQAGDLLESRVKRLAGVKDSSAVFGPSGGVLDVVDSLLLSAPLWFLVAPLCFV
jgi:phosphatidate cytidylyltransferase